MKIFIFLITCLVLSTGWTQVIIKPLLINQGTGNCDNTVVVSGLNIPTGAELVRRHKDNGVQTETVIDFGDTITDFCIGIDPAVYDEVVLVQNSFDSICFSSLIVTETNFQLTGYTLPSGTVTQDGNLTLTFDSVLDVQYMGANNPSGVQYSISSLDNQSFYVDGIQNGSVFIYYNDPVTNTVFHTTVYVSSPYLATINNLLQYNRMTTDNTGGCNGSVIYTPNGIGPYTYEWSNGTSTVDSLSDTLCPGFYQVLITDQTTQENALDAFIIVDSSDIYIDTSIAVIPTDTINGLVVACGMDYSLPIDSVAYNETFISGMADSAIFAMEITMYQGTNAIFISDTILIIDSTQVYQLNYGVYCDYFKSAGFSGKRVILTRRTGEESLFVMVEDMDEFQIFPIPGDKQVFIQGAVDSGKVYRSDGVFIENYSGGTIHTEEFANGLYFIRPNGVERVFRVMILH